MADIKINELRPAGSEFFGDNESYMNELTEDAINGLKVWGGSISLASISEVSSVVSGELSGVVTGLTGAISGELTGAVSL